MNYPPPHAEDGRFLRVEPTRRPARGALILTIDMNRPEFRRSRKS